LCDPAPDPDTTIATELAFHSSCGFASWLKRCSQIQEILEYILHQNCPIFREGAYCLHPRVVACLRTPMGKERWCESDTELFLDNSTRGRGMVSPLIMLILQSFNREWDLKVEVSGIPGSQAHSWGFCILSLAHGNGHSYWPSHHLKVLNHVFSSTVVSRRGKGCDVNRLWLKSCRLHILICRPCL
jgi:hypothetical protein